MRFISSIVTLLFLSVSVLARVNSVRDLDPSIDARGPGTARLPKHPKVCNANANGKDLPQLQYDALVDFADLFVIKQDVLTSFDRYVPGEYRQHNPFAPQGRDFAIQVLSDAFANSNITNTNLTIFAGQGYGIMHYKMSNPMVTYAVVDYFKFQGNCIVEHWDVLQARPTHSPFF